MAAARVERDRRHKEYEREVQAAWSASMDARARIERLELVASRYPEQMKVLEDIADLYIDAGDVDAAVRTYQRIIDGGRSFEHAWSDTLGLAYLFIGDVGKAKRLLRDPHTWSSDKGLHLALAHLKGGDAGAFRRAFEGWVAKDFHRAIEHGHHENMVRALLGHDLARVVEQAWDVHQDRYEAMSPFERYRELRATWGGARGRTLGERRFYEMAREYLILDRGAMVGELEEDEWERYFALRDLLHADFTIG